MSGQPYFAGAHHHVVFINTPTWSQSVFGARLVADRSSLSIKTCGLTKAEVVVGRRGHIKSRPRVSFTWVRGTDINQFTLFDYLGLPG